MRHNEVIRTYVMITAYQRPLILQNEKHIHLNTFTRQTDREQSRTMTYIGLE